MSAPHAANKLRTTITQCNAFVRTGGVVFEEERAAGAPAGLPWAASRAGRVEPRARRRRRQGIVKSLDVSRLSGASICGRQRCAQAMRPRGRRRGQVRDAQSASLPSQRTRRSAQRQRGSVGSAHKHHGAHTCGSVTKSRSSKKNSRIRGDLWSPNRLCATAGAQPTRPPSATPRPPSAPPVRPAAAAPAPTHER